MSSLNDLTLVIPTLGREKFVDRQINILRDSGCHVLLLDGGIDGRTSEWARKLPSLFEYHSLPGVSYAARMRFAATRVQSRFVAILADDDIFLPSSLQVLVQKLDLHSSASSAIGRTFRFHVSDGLFRSSQRYDYDCTYFPRGQDESVVSNVVRNLTNQYNYYAIFRREAWLRNVDVAFGIDYSSPYVSEVAVRLLGVLRADGLVVDVLWWLRSDEVVPVSVEGWERRVSFEDWYRSAQTVDEREKFVQLIADFGIERKLWAKDDAQDSVLEVIECYLNATSSPQKTWSSRVLTEIAKRSRGLPRGARTIIKGSLSDRQAQRLGIGSTLVSVKDQLLAKQIEYDEAELDWVTEIVLRSNQEPSK